MKPDFFRRIALSFLSMLFLRSAGIALAQDSASAALERLRALAGDWEGSFEWSGGSSSGKMNASYYSTGNGSVVIENLITEGKTPIMTSAYHMDGADLRMTHYCAAQNQPRLKATRINLAQGILDFEFVDITNLRSPDAPHVVGLEMRFLATNHITITFLFQGAGKSSREHIDLKRAAPKAPAGT